MAAKVPRSCSVANNNPRLVGVFSESDENSSFSFIDPNPRAKRRQLCRRRGQPRLEVLREAVPYLLRQFHSRGRAKRLSTELGPGRRDAGSRGAGCKLAPTGI